MVDKKEIDRILSACIDAIKNYFLSTEQNLPPHVRFLLPDGEVDYLPLFPKGDLEIGNEIYVRRVVESLKPSAIYQIEQTNEVFCVSASFVKDGEMAYTSYSAPIVRGADGKRLLDETRAERLDSSKPAQQVYLSFAQDAYTPINSEVHSEQV